MTDIAIYTAVTGGHDYEHISALHPGVDHIFMTDGIARAPHGWKEVMLPKSHLDNRRLSKLPKHVPHQFLELRDYRYLIWIDGDMSIVRYNFADEVLLYLDKGMLLSPHFDGRDDAYSEIEASGHPKYNNQPFAEQERYYREVAGYPGHTGLFETGVLARDQSKPGVKEVGEAWWFETVSWSYQDQVSLPYAMWKVGFTPDVMPRTFRDLNWIALTNHAREDV